MPFRYLTRYEVFLTRVGTEEADGTIVFGCRRLVCGQGTESGITGYLEECASSSSLKSACPEHHLS